MAESNPVLKSISELPCPSLQGSDFTVLLMDGIIFYVLVFSITYSLFLVPISLIVPCSRKTQPLLCRNLRVLATKQAGYSLSEAKSGVGAIGDVHQILLPVSMGVLDATSLQ